MTTLIINNNFEFETGSKLTLETVSSNLNSTTATYQIMKIDEQRQNVFLAKVGKAGQLLKVSAANMLNVSFDELATGQRLGNVTLA